MTKLALSRILAASVSGLALMTAATAAGAQAPIRPGQAISETLARGDEQLDSGEYFDPYSLRGHAGDRVVVRMESGEFDPYLIIQGPGQFSHDNDDAEGGTLDALLDVRLPTDGDYRILATSYAPGERGRYTVSIDPVRGASERGGDRRGDRYGDRTQQARPSRQSALVPGQSRRGALDRGDAQLTSGEYSDTWTIDGYRGQTYTVTMSSSDFDAYLMARGPGGLSEDNDDDAAGRGSTDSRLSFTAPADGPIVISATSYAPGETGAYAIRLDDSYGNEPRSDDQPRSAGQLTLGRPAAGRLAQGARQLASGEYVDTWRLNGRRGDTIDLQLTSHDFDPYLMVRGPGDFSAYNDDDPASPGSRDARLVITLPADGAYEVMATSYAAGETGAYQLSADRGVEQAQQSYQSSSAEQLTGIGRTERGELRRGDGTLSSGEYVDNYIFSGQRGQRVEITATSDEFDTYILLTDPEGDQLDNDDGIPGTTDSRIEMALPITGEYTIGVTSYAPGETGRYQLGIQPSLGSARQQAVQGGARVFAVMVGVSEYGSTQSDLPYTDEDAEQLAATLEREGVLNPASIVITNADATVGAVRSAFRRVAAQAGPDDVFMFFFSGHGSQNDLDAPTATELDGREETIVLRDGEITDTELAEMFAQVDTRLALLVLDSCFSGGFAKNVINRPGVMGLFSSEEDLTSAVAEKFEAGGYLSHFLRAGLAGEADGDGDAIVTAGELSAYLRRQFNLEVHDVQAETTEGQRNYQNLVVDRGGVQVDDVVIRLAPR
jgi:hypothetical protein